mmetsp:Transcript_38482/g.58573  ORF Transcript_38482/g.58573 Transcript_38482/m.58573 type:complete len:82 (-) Transcript_38482:529-774(-)
MTLGSTDDFKGMATPFTPKQGHAHQGEPQTEEVKGVGEVSMFNVDGVKEPAEEVKKFICHSLCIEIPEPNSDLEQSISPKK